jgi:hypothetical protein
MAKTFFGDISLSAINAGFQGLRGGKRTRQLISAVAQALADRDTFKEMPLIMGADAAVSLGGAQDIQVFGQNFLVPSQDAGKQAKSYVDIFKDNDNDFVRVYAISPGKLGDNIEVTVAAAGTAAVADSDEATTAPKVLLTPETGDVDASIAAWNASKLVYAVKFGTGGTIASSLSQNLDNGRGEGVRLVLGNKVFQDTSEHGSLFVGSGNGTYIKQWEEDHILFAVGNADLAVGEAVPTGKNALTAVESHLLLRLEWVRPLFEAQFPLAVKA